MKKNYEKPFIEIFNILDENIILSSKVFTDDDGEIDWNDDVFGDLF